jgi:hypothetical protein
MTAVAFTAPSPTTGRPFRQPRSRAAARCKETGVLALTVTFILAAALLPAPARAQSTTPLPNPEVVITTNYGSITVRLFRDKAPATVENFLTYVKDGFYDGTLFHRVVAKIGRAHV